MASREVLDPRPNSAKFLNQSVAKTYRVSQRLIMEVPFVIFKRLLRARYRYRQNTKACDYGRLEAGAASIPRSARREGGARPVTKWNRAP